MKLIKFAAPLTSAVAADDYGTALITDVIVKNGIKTQSVRFFYSYSDTPLAVSASGVKEGDTVIVLIHSHRLEMWVNGILYDEEWPCGEMKLDCVSAEACLKAGITLEDYPDADDNFNKTIMAPDAFTDCGISANEDAPSVMGHIISKNGENAAEGWKPRDINVFVGDGMPYMDYDEDGNQVYHVLYLKDRHHHCSKWHKGAHQWAHISTKDLMNWDIHPLTVSIDDRSEGSICTGSWLKTENGIHYLYYTVRPVDDSPAPLLRSVSEDGYHYRRDDSFRITLSERYHGNSARDPKIVKADDGYHMFVTTSLMTGEFKGRGALAHLTSPDGITWNEGDPIYISPNGDQPECSDYFKLNGWYYLICSLGGRGQYMQSRKPFSEWIMPSNPYIPCETVPKMALLNSRIIFTGYRSLGGYAGNLAFTEAWQNEDGTLRFNNK